MSPEVFLLFFAFLTCWHCLVFQVLKGLRRPTSFSCHDHVTCGHHDLDHPSHEGGEHGIKELCPADQFFELFRHCVRHFFSPALPQQHRDTVRSRDWLVNVNADRLALQQFFVATIASTCVLLRILALWVFLLLVAFFFLSLFATPVPQCVSVVLSATTEAPSSSEN